MAVVYACFVVRSHFLTEAEENLAYAGVLLSRAALCEILAMKLLGRFAACEIQLAAVLTASWNPLVGAPEDIQDEVIDQVGTIEVDPQCALEVCRLFLPRARMSLTSLCADGHRDRVQTLHILATRPGGGERHLQRTRRFFNDISSLRPCGQL